jgi:hypothetical protein
MAARHRFVPTQRSAERRAPSRSLIRAGTAWAVVLAAVVLVARPFLESSGVADASSRFVSSRGQFRLIKDMLLSEPTLTSVGIDNVREYWLFDGRWSSPRAPGRFLTRDGMLTAVGLSSTRYDSYLSLLKSVGAHRAVRAGSGRDGRVTVHLVPTSRGAASRVVFDPLRSRAVGGTALDDGWYLDVDPA